MNIQTVIFIIILIKTAQCEPPSQECSKDSNWVVEPMKTDHGSLETFYDIGQGISEGSQDHVLDSLRDEFAASDDSSKVDAGETLYTSVKSQGGFIFMLLLGFLIGIGAIVLAIVVACFSCFGNSCFLKTKPAGKFFSKIVMFLFLGFLSSCFIILLAAGIIYMQSVKNLFDTIESFDKLSFNVMEDVTSFITGGVDQLSCVTNGTANEAFDSIESKLRSSPDKFAEAFYDDSGLRALKANLNIVDENFKQCKEKLGILQGFLCPQLKIGLTELYDELAAVEKGLSPARNEATRVLQEVDQKIATTKSEVYGDMNSSIESLHDTRSKVQSALSGVKESISDIGKWMNKTHDEIDKKHEEMETDNTFENTKDLMRVLVILPICFALVFSGVGIGLLVYRIFFALVRRSNCLRFVIMIGFYLILCSCLLVMLVAILFFVVGFVFSAICQPVFQDPTYEIFGPFNHTVQGYKNQTSATLGFRSFMDNCSSGETMFVAVGGSRLLTPDMIKEESNMTKNRENMRGKINATDLQFRVDDSSINGLQNARTQLDNATKNFEGVAAAPGCDSMKQESKELSERLSALSTSFKDLQTSIQNAKKNSENIDQLKEKMIKRSDLLSDDLDEILDRAANRFVEALMKDTLPCKGLTVMYGNIGDIFCHKLGGPIHGIWASAGLAGILFIPTAVLLMLSSKYIFTSTGIYIKISQEGETEPMSADDAIKDKTMQNSDDNNNNKPKLTKKKSRESQEGTN